MNFLILTIFPELFDAFRAHGMVRRALELRKIEMTTVQIRDFAEGRHRVTDDRPYGGGCGMVMKPEPLAAAIRFAKAQYPEARTMLLTPQGRRFNQALARELADRKSLILVCGRYEGIDERIGLDFVDEEVSIGDYVLTGGELGAMVIMDAVTRLIPGVLGGDESALKDSFSDYLLEHGHYTRPAEFEGTSVPEVLLSGNHAEIEKWRLEASLIRTFLKRRDLLQKRSLSPEEAGILKRWCREIEKLISLQSAPGADSSPGAE
jgi:tRNA (guanine37-N1)-methyltransferase